MERDLRGRLETVKLIYGGDKICIGETYDKKRIKFLNYKKRKEDYLCLVRFDLKINEGYEYPLGNFISSKIPLNFQSDGLSAENFIFFGKWKKYWIKGRDYPNVEELNLYYDPGHIGTFLYFERKRGGWGNGKKFKIQNSLQRIPDYVSIRESIKNWLPDPNENSRVVIAEAADELFSIKKQIETLGIMPIKMQPLRD